ncbi:MAG: hypothetical protein GY862_29810, partial [Gammaproteobacteria bacterium]|nr:hypothetical protein [Gammaproteobacteria bacterium]
MPAIEFETVSRNGAVSTPARYSDWDMQYPLTERIGNPELLAGREKEFRLINKWLSK